MRAHALLCVLALAAPARAEVPAPPPAPAAPEGGPPVVLAAANKAAIGGDWDTVERFVLPLFDGRTLTRADRAEAHRLLGLAAFFRRDTGRAEQQFVAYLQLEPNAHLDPSLAPPEAVAFFEDVRARHAELRPAPERSRRFVYNLLPPLGQLQNGHRTKAILVGSGLVALVATNVTTYLLLRSWCGGDEHLCETDSGDHTRSARTVRAINIGSGAAAIALFAYGVIDGIWYYRQRRTTLRLEPTQSGGAVVLEGRF